MNVAWRCETVLGAAFAAPWRRVGLLLVLVLASCGKTASDPTASSAPKPVPVLVASAKTSDVPMRLQAVGTVEPFSTVVIRPQVGGVLTEAAFEEGHDVSKGDVLFRIDDRQYAASLKQAEAALARDEILSAAAARDAARYVTLVQKSFASQEDQERLTAQSEGYKASVSLDQALVEQARLQRSWCTIRSPIDGRAGPILLKPGNLVQPNVSMLVTLNQVHPIRVVFPVPEGRLPEVRALMARGDVSVSVRPEGDPGDPIQGSITFLDNVVDRATGTFLLKATFENSDNRLWPGHFVRVTAMLGTRVGATVVPASAVQDGQSGPYLFVVKADGTADLRNVRIGPVDEGLLVIESGIEPGDRVVVDGQVRLSPGTRVEIRQ